MNKTKSILYVATFISISLTFFACSSGGGSGGGSTYSCQFSNTCVSSMNASDCIAAGGDPVDYCPGSGGGSSSSGGGSGGVSSSSRTGNVGTDIYDSRDGKTYKTIIIGTQTWMAENLNYKTGDSKCYGEDGLVDNGIDVLMGGGIPLSNEEIQANCDKYGRLYDWATAMKLDSDCNSDFCLNDIQESKHEGICPSGWHLPTRDEWKTLIDYAGGNSTDSKHLKATSDWYCWSNKEQAYVTECNNEDTYGFTALPGGEGSGSPYDYGYGAYYYYYSVGTKGYWWSASTYSLDLAYSIYIGSTNSEYSYINDYYNYKSYSSSIRCVKN